MTSKKTSKKTKATDSPLRAATRHASESLASGGPSKKTKPSKPAKKTKPTAVRTDPTKHHLSEPKQYDLRGAELQAIAESTAACRANTAALLALSETLDRAVEKATASLGAAVIEVVARLVEAQARQPTAEAPGSVSSSDLTINASTRGTTTGDQVLIKDAAGRVVDSYTLPARETPVEAPDLSVRLTTRPVPGLQAGHEVVIPSGRFTTSDGAAPSPDPYADAFGDEVTDQLLADL